MAQMTGAQWREFVMAGTRTGKLAVTRRDGRPHVTPVWFALDGDDIVLTTHSSGVKARVLRRNPSAALCVDEQRPPYSFVLIEGTAELSEELAEIRRWATVLGGRYMGRTARMSTAAATACPASCWCGCTSARSSPNATSPADGVRPAAIKQWTRAGRGVTHCVP